MISVVKTSLEAKRQEFLAKQTSDDQTRLILKPLIKRQEIQFKNLFKIVKAKMSRQTFVTYLQKATDANIITKREVGRTTYYSFNLKTPEEETLKSWFIFVQKRLSYIPDEIRLV
jgi:DNA-binding transcriptional ArsR family regulator